MQTTDRMGGFIEARIIELKNVTSVTINENTATINLKSEKSWIILDHQKNGININVSAQKEKAGQIFAISAKIDLKNSSNIKITSFNKFLLIAKNPKGEEFLFGTYEFPLRAKKTPITTPNPSGKVGETVDLDGKQPYYPYIIRQ